MSKRGLDWYKREPVAFLDGVQGMGPELIGAYAVLLDLFYARGGDTRRDDRHLAGILGCSVRKATALTDALIDSGKVVAHGEHLTNKRAETEAKRKRNEHETRVKAQRERRENEGAAKENNGLPDKVMSAEAPLEKEREKDKSGGGSAREASFLDEVREAANAPETQTWTTDPFLSPFVDRWRALPLTDDEILTVIRGTVRGQRGPNTPAYFDQPMQRAAGVKHAPALVPIPGTGPPRPSQSGIVARALAKREEIG